MTSYRVLLKLQIKLLTKGDKMLCFYLLSWLVFLILRFYALPLWKIFFALSNLYLMLLYSRDSGLTLFYKVLNINEHKIHVVKTLILYALSFLLLISIVLLNRETNYPVIFTAHFLSFYTFLIFYNYWVFVRLFILMLILFVINLILSAFPLLASSLLIFTVDTLILIYLYHEQIFGKKLHFI